MCLTDDVGAGYDEFCNEVGKPRVLHPLRDGKCTGNRYENVPANVFAVFARIENLCPCHNNGGNTDEEEHVEPDIGNQFTHKWQFAHCGTYNHECKQQKRKISFLLV